MFPNGSVYFQCEILIKFFQFDITYSYLHKINPWLKNLKSRNSPLKSWFFPVLAWLSWNPGKSISFSVDLPACQYCHSLFVFLGDLLFTTWFAALMRHYQEHGKFAAILTDNPFCFRFPSYPWNENNSLKNLL